MRPPPPLVKKFWVFSDKDFLEWLIPPPIQLGWRDFTGFSPRIQQFSSRFRRELLNSRRESSNSRRIFSNSRQRIRRELLVLQKITTKREKRKVNLVATEKCPILCCDENYYSRHDENCPILCCDENSNSRRDEICPILYNLENMYDSFSDVGESQVWCASKNMTPCRMHWNAFLTAQFIAKCHGFPNMYDML